MLATAALLAALVPGTARAATPAPSPSASATNVVTFGVQPATATDRDQRPFFTYDVTPGATLADHVAVLNFSLKPIAVTVYATDASNSSDGGFSLLAGKQQPVDAGSWLSLEKPMSHLTIPARASAQSGPGETIIPFTLTVPSNAQPGDHAAGILAVLSTVGKDAKGADVQLDQRVGSRVYVRVSGPLKPGLQIQNLHISYHQNSSPVAAGTATVSFTVVNAGNVKLGARPTVKVNGWFGLSNAAGKMNDIPLLFPGARVPVTVLVKDVWPSGRLTGKVSILPLRLEGDDDGALPAITAHASAWAIPWLLILIIVLLIGAALVVRRRRKPSAGAATPAPEKKAPATV